MRDIVPGVHIWSWFSEEKQIDFNGTYVRGPVDAVVIDPPPYVDEDLREMESLGRPVAILLTNVNHVRRSMDLAAHFDIPIRIHELDAEKADASIATTFHDGDDLPGGLKAITLADGKSPGETAFLASWAGTLIIGDAVIGKPAGSLAMLPDDKFEDPLRARQALRKLLDFRFDALILGDGQSFGGGGHHALGEFLQSS